MTLFPQPMMIPSVFYCLFMPIPWLLYLRRAMPPRQGLRGHWGASYVLLLVPAFSNLALIHHPLAAVVLRASLLALVLFTCYEGSRHKEIPVAIVIAACQTALELGCTALMMVTTGVDASALSQRPNACILLYLLNGFLSLGLFLIMGAMTDRSFWGMSRQDYVKFFTLPLGQGVTMFLFVNILIYDGSSAVGTVELLLTALIGLSFAVIDAVMLATFRDIAKGSRLALSNQYLQEENNLRAMHLDALKLQQDQIENMRQDIGHHLEAMSEMLRQKECREAVAFNKELLNRYGKSNHTDYCQHRVINAVLYNKAQLAESHGIDLHIQVLAEAQMGIDDLDLMCVFSNLLDNAIEACQNDLESDRRYIDISARAVRNHLVVSAINSKATQPIPHATKLSDGMVHGIGLLIVKDIAQRYNGYLEVQSEAHRFVATVTLGLQGATAVKGV